MARINRLSFASTRASYPCPAQLHIADPRTTDRSLRERGLVVLLDVGAVGAVWRAAVVRDQGTDRPPGVPRPRFVSDAVRVSPGHEGLDVAGAGIGVVVGLARLAEDDGIAGGEDWGDGGA